MDILKYIRGRKTFRPRGRLEVFCDGELISRSHNLVVTSAYTAMANLAAGVTAGQYISIAGFGSGNTAPELADTDLGTAPKYYNAVGGHSFPEAGEVQFTLNLQVGVDYAAAGMTVTEVGLFANSAAMALPSYVGTGIAAWAANHDYTVGAMVKDSNSRIQRCTAISSAGESGSAAPAWASIIGNTTTDNEVTWTLIATDTVPSPMWAHALVAAFDFTGSAGYSINWTIDL
jgi:hypothetical protein